MRIGVRRRAPAVCAVLAVAALPAAPAPAALAGARAAPSSSFVGSATSGGSPSSSFTGTGTTSGGSEGGDGGFGSDDSGQPGRGEDGGGLGAAAFGRGASAGLSVTAVRRLQAELARLGYFHHVVTGYYGPVTTSAVRRFQRSAGLRADGIWGPLSQAALIRRLSGG